METNLKDIIKDISNRTYYNMGDYSQLVIDLVEEIEEEEPNLNTSEAKGCLVYEIDNILDIIDQRRTHDIQVLSELKEALKNKEMKEINVQSANDLFGLLVEYGGKVVNTGTLSEMEINQARVSNRIWIDNEPPNLGLGYVWIPTFKNTHPETLEEIEISKICYPILYKNNKKI